MKQLMTAKQAIECYLSDANYGTQFLKEHFKGKYGQADMEFGNIMDMMAVRISFHPDEDGVEICDALRMCEEKINKRLSRNPKYLHHGTYVDTDGRLVMMFKKSSMTPEQVANYLRFMEVE